MNTERIAQIRDLLTEALAPTELEVIDDSAQHIGHPGASTGLGHFTVIITSPKFQEKSLVARHRMVYDALGDMMKTDIHALRIIAKDA